MNRKIASYVSVLTAALCVNFGVAHEMPTTGPAAVDDHGHDHGDIRHDEPRHRPAGSGDGHAGHAHPGIDLSHPILVESPLPETKLRINYTFADGDEQVHAAELEAEYAFLPEFSVEAVVPYLFINPDDGDATNGLGDSILAFKFASYAWVDQHVLPAVGVELIFPTGDDDKGTGSDHVWEIEPFLRAGYWQGPFEVIGTVSLGIPLNQTDEENDEEELAFGYGVSALYHVLPSLQVLVEFNGEWVFGDDNTHSLTVSPGVTFQPFDDKSINLGVGVSLPVTDDRDFDYAVNAMTIFHF